MTITTDIRKIQVTGTGSVGTINVTFPFIEADDLIVTSRVNATGVGTVLAVGVHYSVAGGDYSTGTVTVLAVGVAFYGDGTMTWTIERRTDRTQATDWVENDQFSADSLEKSQDKQTYLAQDVGEDVDRALKIPVEDDAGIGTTLPSKVDRASKSLGFDAAGAPIALSGTVSGDVTVTPFMVTVLDDTTDVAARATLGVPLSVVSARADLIVGNATPIEARLVKGAANSFLKMDATATDITWSAETIPVLAGSGDGGKHLQANSFGTVFEVVTPVLSQQNTTSDWRITSGATIAADSGFVAHGITTDPHIVMGVLQCITTEHGYSVEDRVIPHMQINTDATKSDGGLCFWWDGTNMGYAVTATHNLQIVHKTLGTLQALTAASWKVMMRAFA